MGVRALISCEKARSSIAALMAPCRGGSSDAEMSDMVSTQTTEKSGLVQCNYAAACQNCCRMYTPGNMLKIVISSTDLTNDR